ncbi:hypothetical protein J5F27_08265 [Schleiferilactobacillus harbinensis]|jgi:hypothetical protein|uniref:Uncharacterized protein n=1 Tax=Schleiferilactobacillus harbinensis TaxID=304207 RepID=A0A510TSZ6_9LACO|nr:hypothetical protein [Schleiferilactobacillus harbinensis]MBO3091916.1 hypothetical protein [Schleiferilactobacillus harbinensis]MCI1688443.1 hypothetical protein [Schleiferilactobacillus harbinensis]MCI1783370.1 hypothetical protein [Schleiferilactobacillus harbinensis]MCI1849721.1 hypothetical protein [Schleiferilactobacillus harbinensis]QFR22306.1 hypothetical protein D1010_01950 [Schleiferilactobacillus harbinensis]
MKNVKKILGMFLVLAMGLVLLAGGTGVAQAATTSLTGVTKTDDSVDRIWMSFNSPTDQGAYWFYEYYLPGVSFRGYLSRTQDIHMLNMTAFHYEGYLYNYNIRNIPIPVLDRHQPTAVNQ